MDIKQNCQLSSLLNYYNPITSTPQNPLQNIYSSESKPNDIHSFNLASLVNDHIFEKSDLLNEQFRLEHKISHEASVKTQESFEKTYSSLQEMLFKMQLKLASIFLEETEYLKQHEKHVEQEEQSLANRLEQLKRIQNERESIEKEFIEVKTRLEMAVIQVTNFQTDGVQILRTLFAESHQIDEELSTLLSQCLASLCRSRTIVNSKINEFSKKSKDIQSELISRQILIRNSESSIALMLELVNALNQLNVEHSRNLAITMTDFETNYQDFNNLSQIITKNLDIKKEMSEIHLLESEKSRLEQELLEQTVLLENIYTILEKGIIS